MVSSADGLTRYYFSKPGNPAYPFAVKLRIEAKAVPGSGGCLDVDLPIASSAEDAGPAAYEAADHWMTVIEDGVLREYADVRRR